MTAARARMLVAAALFLGWMGWLSYAALSKYRGPVVSRALAAVTTHPVKAELNVGEDGKPSERVTVRTPLAASGPPADTQLDIRNLPSADGFAGPGDYLLLLVKDPARDVYSLAVPPRSPGHDPAQTRAVVYPWGAGVEAQAKALFR